MKEHILKLIELKPNIGYFTLCKIFGLTLKELFKLLGIKNYKIKDTYLHIYDTNGNVIYFENSDGSWWKYKYDDYDNLIYSEFSNGDWNKWEYDANGNKIYSEDSNGYKYKY